MFCTCVQMIVYIIQLGLLVCIAFVLNLLKIDKAQRDKFFLFISFFTLVFVAGFRGYHVGTDTNSYLMHWQNGTYRYMESGFVLLSDVIKTITRNKTVYLFICSAIIYFFMFRAIYKMSESPILSVLFFYLFGYYIWSFNLMRQFIAISFSLNAFYYAKERNIIPYIGYSLLCILFHTSGIVTLVYFVFFLFPHGMQSRIHISKRAFSKLVFDWIFPPAFLIVSLLFSHLLLSNVFIPIVNTLAPRYLHYFQSDYFGEIGGKSSLVISCFVLLGYYYFAEKNDDKLLNTVILFAGAVVGVISLQFSLLNRIGIYFYILWIYFVPNLIVKNNLKGWLRIMFQISLMLIGLIYFSYLCSSTLYGAKDYCFFWE